MAIKLTLTRPSDNWVLHAINVAAIPFRANGQPAYEVSWDNLAKAFLSAVE